MELEFAERGILYAAQEEIRILYKGRLLQKAYIADLVCYDQIILEIKRIRAITDLEEAQLLNYLKAAQLPVGVIVNFGAPQLE